MQSLEQLNSQFGINKSLQFEQDESDFIFITINNTFSTAKISTYAGQVLSFQPHGEKEDLLFLSDKAVFQDGKAIRGGIPVCWPWFGDDRSGLGLPSHGFARNQPWQVVGSKSLSDGCTSVTLLLTDTDESRSVWPHQFELYLEVIVGKELTVNLTSKNTGNKPFTITQALHCYFNISDVSQVEILDLAGKNYLDKLDNFSQKVQQGEVIVDKELDRIYQDVPTKIQLEDLEFKRKVTISSWSEGKHNTVIWNPWEQAIVNIGDLDNDQYRKFVCIETANTEKNKVTLLANEQYTLSSIYSMESLALSA